METWMGLILGVPLGLWLLGVVGTAVGCLLLDRRSDERRAVREAERILRRTARRAAVEEVR